MRSNGIQTLSQTYLNYLTDLPVLQAAGITHYRLSPHTQDMVAIANVFRDVLDQKVELDEADVRFVSGDRFDFRSPTAFGMANPDMSEFELSSTLTVGARAATPPESQPLCVLCVL